jgi:SAM-dependent methyltransferase
MWKTSHSALRVKNQMTSNTPGRLPRPPAQVTDLEFTRNFTTYVHAAALAPDCLVLDAGCGSGHGAWLLEQAGARHVVAVDLKPGRIAEAPPASSSISSCVMNVEALALRDVAFDLVVCFEVIEHVPEPRRLLAELRRVAAASAVILISTPNRAVRLSPGQLPWNPEHLREYDEGAFRAELERVFPAVELLGTYGRPDLHEYYRKSWAVDARSSRTRNIARKVLPRSIRQLLHAATDRYRVRSKELLPLGIPEPRPTTWPFHLAPATGECLNLFAICSEDPVAAITTTSKLSVRRV